MVPDAALERLNELKAKLLQAKADNNAPLAAKLNTLVGFKGIYNVDNNHYMNVIGLDGNIGVLKIRYTAKQALDTRIAELKASGVDPLAFDTGKFFVFTRTGMGNTTSFKVDVYRESLEGPTVTHVVTQEILDRLETEGFNLDNDEIATRVTPEECAQIVAESDLLTGKSPACDRIIDAKWKARNAATTSEPTEPEDNEPQQSAPLQGLQAQANLKTEAQKAPVSAPVSAPVAAPVTAAATSAQSGETLSDDDFFKQLTAN